MPYKRKSIDLPDGDFLDIDWLEAGHRRVAVLLHGLESDTQKSYMLSMAACLHEQRWDVAAMNYRGCSGRTNRFPKAYHSGCSHDLKSVIEHVLSEYDYEEITLVGISLGGNIALKYLGEEEENVPDKIRKAIAISSPIDLAATSLHLEKGFNKVYLKRFLDSLKLKTKEKQRLFPDAFDYEAIYSSKTFVEFDGLFTAPANGFPSAMEYYRLASAKPWLSRIRTKALLVTAANDPFFPEECYPMEEARASEHFWFEQPVSGGHVGFPLYYGEQNWIEKRTLSFLNFPE